MCPEQSLAWTFDHGLLRTPSSPVCGFCRGKKDPCGRLPPPGRLYVFVHQSVRGCMRWSPECCEFVMPSRSVHVRINQCACAPHSCAVLLSARAQAAGESGALSRDRRRGATNLTACCCPLRKKKEARTRTHAFSGGAATSQTASRHQLSARASERSVMSPSLPHGLGGSRQEPRGLRRLSWNRTKLLSRGAGRRRCSPRTPAAASQTCLHACMHGRTHCSKFGSSACVFFSLPPALQEGIGGPLARQAQRCHQPYSLLLPLAEEKGGAHTHARFLWGGCHFPDRLSASAISESL